MSQPASNYECAAEIREAIGDLTTQAEAIRDQLIRLNEILMFLAMQLDKGKGVLRQAHNPEQPLDPPPVPPSR